MRVSLRQLAKCAGVSDATVSRVLSDADVRIAPDTRERVRRIAAEMGYEPNRAARALATGKTQTLALWVHNIRTPYYRQLIYSAREEVLRHGYDLMISSAEVRPDGSLDTSKLMSWPVDGVIAVDLLDVVTVPGAEKSLLWDKPLVSIGAYVTPNADYVQIDFADASRDAVLHLSAVGCRRIAYLAPDDFTWYRQVDDARLRGYSSAMAQLEMEPEYIVASDQLRRSMGPAIKEYVERNGCPDGMFCFNDDMAIGAYRALRDMGIRIPEDVALIGCDGIEDTEYLDPQMSTVGQPVAEMCSTAWWYLSRRLKQPDLPLQQMTIQAQLVVRGSSKRPNACPGSFRVGAMELGELPGR